MASEIIYEPRHIERENNKQGETITLVFRHCMIHNTKNAHYGQIQKVIS